MGSSRSQNLAILLTDIAGFTAATSRQSREENAAWLQVHAALLKPAFAAFGGTVVKEIGDAFLCTFPSPTDAVLCGTAILDQLWSHNQQAPASMRLDVRVVVGLGEVRVEGGEVLGEPLNVAARVEEEAKAGEVTLTEAVFLTMTRSEVELEFLGAKSFTGLPEPVALYRVLPVCVPAVPGQLPPSYPYGGTQLHRLAVPVAPRTGPAWETLPPGTPAPHVPVLASHGPVTPVPAARTTASKVARLGGKWFFLRLGAAALLLLAVAGAAVVAYRAWDRRRQDPFARIEERLAAGDIPGANDAWDRAEESKSQPAWRLDYYLGRISALERNCDHTLGGYRDALRANEELARDPRLNHDVVACLDEPEGRAAKLIRRRLGKESARALASLAEAKATPATARMTALVLLDGMGEADRVNQREVLLAVLQGDAPCPQRREALLKLVARKDPKAHPALRAVLQDSGPEGRLAKQNKCLVGVLAEAVKAGE
jgi:class 3 adenylate cyclase